MNEKLSQKRPHLIPCVVVAGLLILALVPWPYAYYQLLRWAVCAAAVFVAYKAYTWKQKWAVWVFAAIAVIFNPLAPIHLPREAWQVIDLPVAALFAVAAFKLTESSGK